MNKEVNTLKKTALQKLHSALKRGPKRGLTVAELAERTDLSPSTVSKTLASADFAGIVGYVQTGRRGRPANIYGLIA